MFPRPGHEFRRITLISSCFCGFNSCSFVAEFLICIPLHRIISSTCHPESLALRLAEAEAVRDLLRCWLGKLRFRNHHPNDTYRKTRFLTRLIPDHHPPFDVSSRIPCAEACRSGSGEELCVTASSDIAELSSETIIKRPNEAPHFVRSEADLRAERPVTGAETFSDHIFSIAVWSVATASKDLRSFVQICGLRFPKPPVSCTLIGIKIFFRFRICLTALAASAQHLVDQKTFDAIATEYSGEEAQENIRRIVESIAYRAAP